ncbi:HalOD1 output domain-containing protein [Natrinema salaciae]|uniref:Halobacterial output domain-containing protein n=1 Tax=Natrinema salaciae TaxID=1186196 RepID=A0A1H9BL87_9EURY|nr:HalOD1 output domain-containing protein [Natrinema salaciae]SEP89527.1 hypothetical protein SAMN04489841_0780 [Natrinema salaciae]
MSDDSRTKPPSELVVEAVATEHGVDPLELECVLADAIDPTALDALFESTASRTRISGFVEFTYCSHEVTVRADGSVDVR